MASTQARVYFEGLPRLVRLLKEDAMLLGIWKDAMREATSLGEESARRVAGEARGTGRMAASITSTLSGAPVPKSGVIKVPAIKGSAHYAFILQSGKGKKRRRLFGLIQSHATLHFRGSGKPTRGWLNRAIADVQGQINGILEQAARQIEERWANG